VRFFDCAFLNVQLQPQVAVEGAEPGDALEVEILHIDITRCWSVWETDVKVCGCLAAKRHAISDKASVRSLPIVDGMVELSDRLKLPLRPMIGCIATAPVMHDKHEFGCGCSSFEPTYPHGGNMDLAEMRAGAWCERA
jgi:amidase